MHSLRILGLGAAFALGGIALFAVTLRKPAEPKGPITKKSEMREREAQRAAQSSEAKKLRLTGAVCVLLGAALMILS
jgi:hypothetical protein